MILRERLCWRVTAAVFLFAVSLFTCSAIAQTPAMSPLRFGGSGQESLAGFAIDRGGNYYLAGTTASLDLPATALQKHPGGAYLYRFRAGHADRLYPAPAAVSAIASDPSHTGNLYAAFSRAVWRSPDGGDSWQRLDADWPTNTDCTSITAAPMAGRTVYVLCPAANSPFAPQALFRSVDAGAAWTRAAIEQTIQGHTFSNYAQFHNLTLDPFHPNSLWASGLIIGEMSWFVTLHSTDGGDTWTQTDPTLVQFGFDNRRPGIAYALGFDGFYRTMDSGQTWTKLETPPQVFQSLGSASFAILPSGDVLAAVGRWIERSRDGGRSWQSFPLPAPGQPCQGLYAEPSSALRADPVSGAVYLQLCGQPRAFIFRSDDAATTWQVVNTMGLPDLRGHAVVPAGGGADYFAIVRKSSDVFVAKLNPSGDIIWSTFLGGVHDETATGLALDPNDNSVYVTGTTLSDDFPFTSPALAKTVLGVSGDLKSFLAKLSPDGAELEYSAVFGYDTMARALAADSSGDVYVAGNAGATLPTTPGAYRPALAGKGPNPFILKIDPSAARVVYGTYLAEASYSVLNSLGGPAQAPIVANAIAIDEGGNAYVGGTYIWKLNPDGGGLAFSTQLDGGIVNAIAVGPPGNVYVGGAANTLTFPTTPGAFQTQLLPTICGIVWNGNIGNSGCWAAPAFVAKLGADANQLLYSTYLGGDGFDAAASLALAADGTVYAAGQTSSRSFPTRLPIQGPLGPLFGENGFVSALVPDGSDIAISTYVADGRPFHAVAVALDPAGNPVVAGYNVGGARNEPGPESDVLIFRLDYSAARNVSPRLDSILNAASRTGTPLAAGQRVVLEGAGFHGDSQVCFDDACVPALAVSDAEILAVPPDSIASQGWIAVRVQSPDGTASNQVNMPAGTAKLALYSADNTGTGMVLALNEDGMLNSPANPARRGTTVMLPANGFDSSANIGFGGIVRISVTTGKFPGIPGEIPLIRATIDPNLSAAIQSLTLMGSTFPGHMPVSLAVGGPGSSAPSRNADGGRR